MVGRVYLTYLIFSLGGNKGSPHHLLILEHKIKWFLLIFWEFSGKNDAKYLARITVIGQEIKVTVLYAKLKALSCIPA